MEKNSMMIAPSSGRVIPMVNEMPIGLEELPVDNTTYPVGMETSVVIRF